MEEPWEEVGHALVFNGKTDSTKIWCFRWAIALYRRTGLSTLL